MIYAEEKADIQYISPTGLECFARCPARYFFSKVLRLQSSDQGTLPLVFGKCIHACLYKAYEDPAAAFGIFLEHWNKEGVEGDSARNPDRALSMLENFHFFHKNAQIYRPLDPPQGVIESAEKYCDYEAPFLIDIGADIPLYGKIDRMVSWGGSNWPLDYKTASQITERINENFDSGFQTGFYTLALGVLTGEMPKGILYEFLRVSPKNDEVNVYPVFVPEKWLEYTLEQAKTLCRQILACNEAKCWPNNVSGCAPYGQFGSHGYKCEYFSLCQANDWRPQTRYFHKNEWDPLGKQEASNA